MDVAAPRKDELRLGMRAPVHIHAQSIVELGRKVVLVCRGSEQHVAITTSITISNPLFSWLMLSK